MPEPSFEVGIGPSPLEAFDIWSYLAPADTNSTTNLISPMMPVMLPVAPNNNSLTRPAANAIPTGIATHKQASPNGLTGVITVPNPVLGSKPAGIGTLDLPYSNGSVPAGSNLQVVADGAGSWTIVASGSGIGRVRKAVGGRMLVEF